MTTAWIFRIAYTPHGTFGILEVNNFRCYTLEPPYDNNKRGVSCIPTGSYTMKKGTYAAGGGYTNYEIQNVQEREYIEIHAGNCVEDTLGCILLGYILDEYPANEISPVLGIKGGTSRPALDDFVKSMGGQEIAKLEICNADDILIFGQDVRV